MSHAVPRPEYPRPQFVRQEWMNLNGQWEFEIDHEDSGLERGLGRAFDAEITVPFAPESELSGIGETDFLDVVWYRRRLVVPESWDGRRIMVHFGAVDHDATVWVNGHEVARHRGGFTPFSADITDALDGREGSIVVRARDTRTEPQARGKQATWRENTGCHYTRTTGIWQTVWMEPVATSHLKRPVITPDVANSRFQLTVPVVKSQGRQRLRVVLSGDAGVVTEKEIALAHAMTPVLDLPIPADRVRLWSPDDPFLYGVALELIGEDGQVMDRVESYAGLRSVRIEGHKILLNEQPVFQRLVLDQGYYPDGLMTAPSDEALVRDIELSLAAGFNGARLHQKVFEERFLYHADRLGYLVWGEFGDWGAHAEGTGENCQQPTASFVTQWIEAVERDRSHPSIIGWCGLNETFAALGDRITVLDDVTKAMFYAAKFIDPTRPVLDTSGYSHRVLETDVWDSHLYEQDPAKFGELMTGLADGKPYGNPDDDGSAWSLPYRGQPYFCSEYGGIWWSPGKTGEDEERAESWGYGQAVGNVEEFYDRLKGLTDVLLDDPLMFGFCYTQLTDVFQEENGIYTFDRREKFDMDQIRAVFSREASYEQQ